MSNEQQLSVSEAYEIADTFAQASARILDYRVNNRSSLSYEDASSLEKYEDSLDHMVVMFRGLGIKLIGAKADIAINELKQAVSAGRDAISQISQVKEAIKLAGAIVDLAVAVLAKDSKAILSAAKTVANAAS